MCKAVTTKDAVCFIRRFLYSAVITISAFVVLTTTARSASAEVTIKDVQTIIRTIGFLEKGLFSGSAMSIIYNPDDNDSVEEAKQIESFIQTENKSLQPQLVPISSIDQIQNTNLAFVTRGLQTHYKTIGTTLRNKKILSFTMTLSCVDQNCCAIYINSENRVRIVVNKSIVDSVNARFKPVFLMMATVI